MRRNLLVTPRRVRHNWLCLRCYCLRRRARREVVTLSLMIIATQTGDLNINPRLRKGWRKILNGHNWDDVVAPLVWGREDGCCAVAVLVSGRIDWWRCVRPWSAGESIVPSKRGAVWTCCSWSLSSSRTLLWDVSFYFRHSDMLEFTGIICSLTQVTNSGGGGGGTKQWSLDLISESLLVKIS